ncbi:hypothetical protein LIER_36013 [Lithospermum erythrorhizon]|uniref:SWIM-type domain-containing protein n=1 Tax=Lithospermum erythrorhizon TaxID=34254 RepID=A0AAV3P1E9_LITER
MPGSAVITKLHEQKFEHVYVCPTPLKKGFLVSCRRFVCLDGCFLKGAFKGQILAAVCLDAENRIYPVTWAVVEVENIDSWTWFVRLLKQDLGMEHQPDSWVLMTNQQKMMWKCARAANEPYFEYKMQQLKNVTIEGYEALRRIDPRKWARSAFHPTTNCTELMNNWAEAFNVFIIREKKIYEYITRASGSPRYEVTYAQHSFVVDIEKKHCSCGLWQLGGIPCVRAFCVYKSQNKDPRKYVHKNYLTKSPYPDILPPDIRFLPGRAKSCRTKDAAERVEEAEKQTAEKAEKKQHDGVFKASRKGALIHCKICPGVGQNAWTCPRKPVDGGSDSQPTPSSMPKKRKTRGSSSQLAPSTREDVDMG